MDRRLHLPRASLGAGATSGTTTLATLLLVGAIVLSSTPLAAQATAPAQVAEVGSAAALQSIVIGNLTGTHDTVVNLTSDVNALIVVDSVSLYAFELNNTRLSLRCNGFSIDGGGGTGLFQAKGPNASLTFDRCGLVNGSALSGGAIQITDGATATLKDSWAVGNRASDNTGTLGGGTIFARRATLAVHNSTFTRGTAYRGGSVFVYKSIVTIRDSTFQRNVNRPSAASGVYTKYGGAIYSKSSRLTVRNCSFQHLHAHTWAGGIYFTTPAATSVGGALNKLYLVDSTFLACTSDTNGGAITLNYDAPAVIHACIVENCSAASGVGGAVYGKANADLVLRDSVLAGNLALKGGGIWLDTCTLTVSNASILNNTATESSGGGVGLYTSTLRFMHSTRLEGNSASTHGGAIYLEATSASLESCSVDSNRAMEGDGGGVFADGTSTLWSRATNFTFNEAGDEGGAVSGADGSALYLSATCEHVAVTMDWAESSSIDGNTYLMVRQEGESYSSRSGATTTTTTAVSGMIGLLGEFLTGAPQDIEDVSEDGYCLSPGTYMLLSQSRYGGGFGGGSIEVSGSDHQVLAQGLLVEGQSNATLFTVEAPVAAQTWQQDQKGVALMEGNSAGQDGGAIHAAEGATLEVYGLSFAANSAQRRGGAMSTGDSAAAVISGTTFASNRATYGGALAAGTYSTLEVSSCSLSHNQASDSGGGIYLENVLSLDLTDSVAVENVAQINGGFLFQSRVTTATLENCTVTGCVARGGSGGAVYSYDSNLDVSEGRMAECAVGEHGGAIYFEDSSSHSEDRVLSLNSAGCQTVAVVLDWTNTSAGSCRAGCGASTGRVGTCETLTTSCTTAEASYSDCDCSGCTCNKGSFGGTDYRYFQILGIEPTDDASVVADGVPWAEGIAVYEFCLEPGPYQLRLVDELGTDWEGGGMWSLLVDGSVLAASQTFPAIGTNDDDTDDGGSGTGASATYNFSVGNVSALVLHDNEAPLGGGGGLYWDASEDPNGVSELVLSGNSAVYGNDTATPARTIAFVGAVDKVHGTASFTSRSGEKPSDPMRVELLDSYGQRVSSEDDAIVLVELNSSWVVDEPRLGTTLAGRVAQFSRGVVELEDLIVTKRPLTVVGLTVSSTLGSLNVAGSSLPATLYLDDCVDGEYLEDDYVTDCAKCQVCSKCGQGYVLFSFVSNVTQACQECPTEGVDCPGGAVFDLHVGYWRTSNTSATPYECKNDEACLGGKVGTDAHMCPQGSMGPYCKVCATGFYPVTVLSSSSLNCAECEGLLATLVVVLASLLLALGLAIVARWTWQHYHDRFHRSYEKIEAKLKILTIFLQLTTVVGSVTYSVTWPASIESLFNSFSFSSFDFSQYMAVNCYAPGFNFLHTLLVTTLLPLGLEIGLTVSVALLGRWVTTTEAEEARKQQMSDLAVRSMVLVAFVAYSPCSRTVFAMFVCEDFDDGSSMLKEDYSISCHGEAYRNYLVYAAVMVFVYPVGVPVVFGAILFLHRDRLKPHVHREELEVAQAASVRGVKNSKLTVRLRRRAIDPLAAPFSVLWRPYKPERWYHELILCGQRLAMSAVVFMNSTISKLLGGMMITTCYLVITMAMRPMLDWHDNLLDLAVNAVLFLDLMAGLSLTAECYEADVSCDDYERTVTIALLVCNLSVLVVILALCYYSTTNQEDRRTAIQQGVVGGRGWCAASHSGDNDHAVTPVFELAVRPRSDSEGVVVNPMAAATQAQVDVEGEETALDEQEDERMRWAARKARVTANTPQVVSSPPHGKRQIQMPTTLGTSESKALDRVRELATAMSKDATVTATGAVLFASLGAT